MMITLLKSKLHQLRITRVDLEYEGSLLVDETLLAAAGMRNFEKIMTARSRTICSIGTLSRRWRHR